MRAGVRFWALPVALALVLAACGGGDDGGGGGGGSGGASAAECPIGAIDEAGGGPVEIVFWHSFTRAAEEAIIALTDAFNESQADVHVTLVNQPGEGELIEKYRAGLASGDLPDVMLQSETSLQQLIDSQGVLPAQACIDAEEYALDDFLPRVLDYYTVEGTLYPMPFNVANPLLYFNPNLFEAAGLDPQDPPDTFDEVREAAEALQASGVETPVALEMNGWHFEQWLALAGATYVDNGNGREARANEATYEESGLDSFTWFDEMVDDGLAIATTTNQIDHILALGNGTAAMTIGSSSGLGTITQVLQSGEFPDAALGVGPIPGPGSGGGGAIVGGASLYMVNRSSDAEQEASWRFLKFLNEPEQVAEWAAATGYIPTRQSATEQPVLQAQWDADPGFKVAYDQFLSGEENDASAGAVVGELPALRRIIEDAMLEMVTQGKSPADALADAKERADTTMAAYNDRLGV